MGNQHEAIVKYVGRRSSRRHTQVVAPMLLMVVDRCLDSACRRIFGIPLGILLQYFSQYTSIQMLRMSWGFRKSPCV